MTNKPTPREVSALETTIAVAWEGRMRPKRDAEKDMLWRDVQALLGKIKEWTKEAGK